MKTTIEVKGYQIVIDETDDLVTVTATKDDETVEEFSLELSEEGVEGFEGGEAQDEEGIKSFGEFGDEEEDFGGEESEEEEMQDEMQDEAQDDDDDDDEEEGALESFQAFVNKRK